MLQTRQIGVGGSLHHEQIAGANSVTGKDVVLVEEHHRALGVARHIHHFQLLRADADRVAVHDVHQLQGLGGEAEELLHAGEQALLVIGVDVGAADLAGLQQGGNAQNVVAVLVGQQDIQLCVRVGQHVLPQVGVEVCCAGAAHGGVNDQGFLAQIHYPQGVHAKVHDTGDVVLHRVVAEHHVGVQLAVLGPGQGLGKHPVIGSADAVHTLPYLVGLRHGTGGKALVLHAGAAGILQGLHSLGSLGLRHLRVILAVVGPHRGVLDGLKGTGDGVPLGRHHAAHGDGCGKVVGVAQDHVPDTGAAHGHTLDVNAVRVNAVGSHIAVDGRLQGRNGVRVGPVLAGALGCKQVGGVLPDHFVRNVEGSTVVGGKLGAVGTYAVLAVEENDQGQAPL